MGVHRNYNGTLFCSLDGEHYEPLGDRDYPYRTAWYEGTKVGLFCYNLSPAAEGGHADFNFLRQRHDGPKPPAKNDVEHSPIIPNVHFTHNYEASHPLPAPAYQHRPLS